MDLQEARELARKKMKGCYVCPECDGKACKGMIPALAACGRQNLSCAT